jgi:predicted component of type VI protein secretion system
VSGNDQDKELVKARSQLVQLKRIMDRKVQGRSITMQLTTHTRSHIACLPSVRLLT